MVWSSDIDGVVAHSAYAWISTVGLSEGTHVITATATDSSARAASMSVTVEVRAGNDAPTARGDSAYAPAAGTAAVDVLSNDSDTEDEITPGPCESWHRPRWATPRPIIAACPRR